MISQDLPSAVPQSVGEEKAGAKDVMMETNKAVLEPNNDEGLSPDELSQKGSVTVNPSDELIETEGNVEPSEPLIETKGKETLRLSDQDNLDDDDSYSLKIVDQEKTIEEKDKQIDEYNDKEKDTVIDSAETNEIVIDELSSEAEKDDTPVDSDDFQCRVCQKIFLSDDEVNEHFSQEHFRLAVGQGILEPESPFPEVNDGYRSIFSADEPDDSVPVEDPTVHNRRISADHHQATPFAEALTALHHKNTIAGNYAGISESSLRSPQLNISRPPLPRGLLLHVQHSNTRSLNPNIRMGPGPVPIHNIMGFPGKSSFP